MSPKRQKPTLRTISIMTGFSLSTVSLALRDGKNLRQDTREKVLATAKKIGYVSDRVGVRLRTGRTNAIGLILDGGEDSVGFSHDLIRGISDMAKSRNFNLIVYPEYERSESEAKIEHIVEAGQVDGLILTHTEPQDRRAKLLLEKCVPFVTHGRTELFTPHAYHDFDTAQFVKMAVHELSKRGATNVLAVLIDNFTFNYQNAKKAFEENTTSFGIKSRIHDIKHGDVGPLPALREFGCHLLDKYDSVDGILFDNELVAVGVATGLYDCALARENRPVIVGKQTSGLLTAYFPEAIGIHEDVYESGVELARLLFALLDEENPAMLQSLARPRR